MTRTRIRIVLEMIKFEHSVFALPFALVGALLAARAGGTFPTWRQLLWIVVAMVGARSAAMTMNRIADVEYDRRNPRTANRALPKGELSRRLRVGVHADRFGSAGARRVAIESAGAEAFAGRAGGAISSIPTRSVLRRGRTSCSAFASGISPAAAWIAIRGSLDWRMLILCAAVTLWVGGFDVLYACQDVEFDKTAGLYSIPKKFGIARALGIARVMHIVMVALARLARAGASRLAWPAWVGIAVVAALLAYEHSLVKPNDLSKMNAAFFTVNGYISLLFLLFWGAATLVMRRAEAGIGEHEKDGSANLQESATRGWSRLPIRCSPVSA